MEGGRRDASMVQSGEKFRMTDPVLPKAAVELSRVYCITSIVKLVKRSPSVAPVN